MYESFPKSLRNFNFCSYLPYLSPYINFVLEILMYIKGCNFIKQQDVKQYLMSAFTDMYETFAKSFRSFNFCSYLPYLSPYIKFVLEILMYIKGRHSIKQ